MGYVRNEEIIGFPEDYLFATYHKSVYASGRLEISWNPKNPALASNGDILNTYSNITKKQFQDGHKNGPSDELLSFFMLDEAGFRQTRTVGCGTMLYLVLDDGIFQPIVERTPAIQTAEGVVNPGAYSRAAGGGIGDVEQDRILELNEELFMVIERSDGTMNVPSFFPEDSTLSDSFYKAVRTKKEKFAEVFGNQSSVVFSEIQTTRLSIAGLTENVVFKLGGDERLLHDRVVTDNPSNGDLEGLDTIELCKMTGVKSTDIKIFDGERKLDGSFWNRTWALYNPNVLLENFNAGKMKFSSAPSRVIKRAPEVVLEIHKHLSL